MIASALRAAVLPFASLALTLPGLCAIAQTPELSAELLVAHPALDRGAAQEYFDDVLAALEASPQHPLAVDAALVLGEVRTDLAGAPDLARIAGLVDSVTDGYASLVLRGILLEEARRVRFSTPFPIGDDLFADYIDQWRVIGPTGPVEHPAPLFAETPADAPERVGVQAATLPSAVGEPLRWHALVRERHTTHVRPDRRLDYIGGGYGYLAAFVRADAPRAQLELLIGGEFRAYWNDQLVIDRATRGPAEREERFVVPVEVAPGWNLVLVRFANRRGARFGARLLDANGRALTFEELPADAAAPPTPSVDAAPPVGAQAPAAPFDVVLAMMRDTAEKRADLALAAPLPVGDGSGEADEARVHWWRARYQALDQAEHLPPEVRRRLELAAEAELERAGRFFPVMRARRVMRLVEEDKPADALAAVNALIEDSPQPVFEVLRGLVLMSLDQTGTLTRPVFEAIGERHPAIYPVPAALAQLDQMARDDAGALAHMKDALAVGAHKAEIVELTFQLMTRAGGDELARARAWLEDWIEAEPGYLMPRRLLEGVARMSNDAALVEALMDEEIARFGATDGARRDLASWYTRTGRDGEALAVLQEHLEQRPGDHAARWAATRLGAVDPAERFFAEFAPDRGDALAAAGSARDASTAEALDSGMIYLFADASSHQRFHTITLALDRKGTELLHEQTVKDFPRVASVLKQDGSVLEPVDVDGNWVMPTLEPGDAIELVWDEFTEAVPGGAPMLSSWRFASFEKPFVRSRYVMFVPDGLPGELRVEHFDGDHREIPWEGGTVHVFQVSDRAREREEVLSPSYREILPWLMFGVDLPLEWIAARWRRQLGVFTVPPADLALELQGLVAQLDAEGADRIARAGALYAAVTEHVLEFQGSAFPANVWYLRRGNPIFLLGVLYDLAEIPYEWAVLERSVSPELDPDPVRPFENLTGFDVPALRIPAEDGSVVWQISPAARGATFGSVPGSLAGATMLVLGDGGARVESLPRDGLEETWDLDLQMTYAVEPTGDAQVTARLRRTTAGGALLREQLSQISDQQRQGAARQIAGQFIPGLDLESFDFPGLDEKGASFDMRFVGRVPRFVQSRGGAFQANLRLPPTGLSTGLGAAQRTWPLALRQSNRGRVQLTVELGESWRVTGAPSAFREQREGYEHSLTIDPAADGKSWSATRVMSLRGLMVPADEMPAFLTRAGEMEKEESRPLVLESQQ